MNRFVIKIIMLICLFIGSIAAFVPGVPFQLNYIGTIVMPVVIFLLVDGYSHTSSKKNYAKRLLVSGEIMFIIDILLSFILSTNGDKHVLLNAIPISVYIEGIICLIIAVVFLVLNCKNKLLSDKGVVIIVFILSIAGTLFDMGARGHIYLLRNNMFIALAGLIILLNALAMEKTKKSFLKFIIVFAVCLLTQPAIIGAAFAFIVYSFRRNKRMLVIGLFVLSGLFIPAFNLTAMLAKPMWMMFFGIIFILLYNDKEGIKIKKPFYFLYPLCVWIPFIIGYIVK